MVYTRKLKKNRFWAFKRYSLIDKIFYLLMTLGFWVCYLEGRSFDWFLMSVFLTFAICSLLIFSKYYNKKLYISITMLFLGVIWFITLFKINTTNYNVLGAILVSISIIFVSLITIKTWENTTQMIDYYNKILENDPKNITALNNKGVQLIAQNKTNKGIECFNKVLKIDPADPAVLYNKSILIKKENKELSKKYREQALKIDPQLKNSTKKGKIIIQ